MTVKSGDHTTVRVMTKPEIDPVDGSNVEGTGGFQDLNADDLKKLDNEGRIKNSIERKASEKLRAQEKAYEKGNWPIPDGKAIDRSGNVVEPGSGQGFISGSPISAQNVQGEGASNTLSETQTPIDDTPKFNNTADGPTSGGLTGDQKVRLISKNPDFINPEGLLSPLTKTGNGIVFPYTPTINIGHAANYGSYDITHSVYQQQFYVNTPNPTISITATFAPQTVDDMAYAVASLNFLKSCTKGDFGAFNGDRVNETAGTPPPVLLLSGYGHLNMKNVPVVVRNVGYTFPEDTDYVMLGFDGSKFIEVPQDSTLAVEQQTIFNAGAENIEDFQNIPAGYISLPSLFLVTLDLVPQYPPTRVRNEFNVRKYRSGELLHNRGFI